LASDAGIIFTPVIAAAVFKALGRNPWVGIAAGYAAASGGFTANLFIAGTDALLAGITESAIKGAPNLLASPPVNPVMNWWFMIAATFVLTFLTVYVTEKYTVKQLDDGSGTTDAEELRKHAVTPAENLGLLYAFGALILYIGLIVLLTYPSESLFRAKDGTVVPTAAGVASPLLNSIMPILFFLFFFIGIAYGYGAGVIKKGEDIPKYMSKGLVGSVGFMVVVLPASLFVELFRMSRFDVILSVKGAEMLKALSLDNFPFIVILLFIILVTFLNFFMMSGSAKWLILAPIFVPMFAQIGLSPALTQIAYRIGDSPGNIITPLSYYMPVVIGLLEQYRKESDPEVGVGTVISLGIPFAVFYLIGFVSLLIVWYIAGWELGPGVAQMIPTL
jgi:aminobenzoyl-glutamate transport protein